jgi:recombination protein RecT
MSYSPASKTQQRLQTTAEKGSGSDALKVLFDRARPQILQALPSHLKSNPDRLRSIALTECRKTPKLRECDPISFLGAIIQAAQLGLEPGPLGHFWLVPKRVNGSWEVVGMLGYRGMIDLSRRSGQIETITAEVVRAGDEFTYALGLNPTLHHIPYDDDGELTHVYAVAKLKGGGAQFAVMTRKAVDKVRGGSAAGQSGPWQSHFEEMARKTVIRRLFKLLPISIEIAKAIDIDERAEIGADQGTKEWLEVEHTAPAAPAQEDPKNENAIDASAT